MMEKKVLDPARLDVVIAILLALVSLTTALAARRKCYNKNDGSRFASFSDRGSLV